MTQVILEPRTQNATGIYAQMKNNIISPPTFRGATIKKIPCWTKILGNLYVRTTAYNEL